MTSTAVTIETALAPIAGAAEWPAEARGLVVSDQPSYAQACEAVRTIKGLRTEIEEKRKHLKAPVLESGRRIDESAKEADAPLKTALDILAPKILGYEREQERIRREEQRRFEEEARVRAEEEALAAAEAAQTQGATEQEVDAILEAPVPAVPIVAARRFERPKGFSSPETWRAEVTDKMALIKAIAAGQASHIYVEVNTVALNAIARAQKETFSVPGVRAVSARGLRSR